MNKYMNIYHLLLLWEEAGTQGTGNTGLRFNLAAYTPFVFPAHDPAEQEIQNMFSLSLSLFFPSISLPPAVRKWLSIISDNVKHSHPTAF